MKKLFFSWPAFALATSLSLQPLVAFSEDAPLPENPAGLAEAAIEQIEPVEQREPLREQRDRSEEHGLFASRYSSMSQASGASEFENRPENKPVGTFQMASWNSPPAMASAPIQGPYPSAVGNSCDSCDCCPDPLWMHRTGAFFDLLILRPGNIDYVYAVEQTGTLPTDSPTGPTGRVGFDSAPGYRFGGTWCLSDCTSIQASYTWFEAGTNDTIAAQGNNVLIFQPGVPSIPNVGASSNQATARYDISFEQLDVDYRGLLWGNCDTAVNYSAGLRYANLEQRFSAAENIGVPVGFTNVNTDIDFDGFGIGFGIEGMRRSAYTGLLIYARGSSSFVAGEFKADYRQTTQFGPNSVVGNSLVDYRVVTMLQSELGLGWQSGCGTFRVLTGYQFNGWFNSLTTGTYIAGVQTRQFDELFETISFDGFTSRLEWRF